MDDILTVQKAFDAAELAADTTRLESLLAEDFQSIGERGYVLDKTQWIARHADFHYVSVDSSQVDIRRYAGTAIVRSVQRSRAVWQGTALELSTRVSHVWISHPDGWRLAAIQFSTLDPLTPVAER
jgi:hypothetical protein